MTQESRVRRLETTGNRPEGLIIVVIPAQWDGTETSDAIEMLRANHRLPAEWKADVMRDHGATQARLLFSGNLPALCKYVAKNSARIGVDRNATKSRNGQREAMTPLRYYDTVALKEPRHG